MALSAALDGDRRAAGRGGRELRHLLAGLAQPDALVSEDYYREGIEINKTLAEKKMLPALAGRNHAMTPADDLPAPSPRKTAP